MNKSPGENRTYPSLLRRYVSTLIDLFVVLGLLFAFAKSPLYDPNAAQPTVWPIWLVVVYEPLLTSFACTAGQLCMHLRVRRVSDLRRPRLHLTLVRWLVKALLGAVSILFLPSQRHRRAIHDLASGTIVENARDVRELPADTLLERVPAD
jgi:uncharacterized RDD family membrane protein YckC